MPRRRKPLSVGRQALGRARWRPGQGRFIRARRRFGRRPLRVRISHRSASPSFAPTIMVTLGGTRTRLWYWRRPLLRGASPTWRPSGTRGRGPPGGGGGGLTGRRHLRRRARPRRPCRPNRNLEKSVDLEAALEPGCAQALDQPGDRSERGRRSINGGQDLPPPQELVEALFVEPGHAVVTVHSQEAAQLGVREPALEKPAHGGATKPRR